MQEAVYALSFLSCLLGAIILLLVNALVKARTGAGIAGHLEAGMHESMLKLHSAWAAEIQHVRGQGNASLHQMHDNLSAQNAALRHDVSALGDQVHDLAQGSQESLDALHVKMDDTGARIEAAITGKTAAPDTPVASTSAAPEQAPSSTAAEAGAGAA